MAQQHPSSAPIDFDIPAQPLDAALAAYFRATGVELLYDGSLTAGRRGTAVRGPMAATVALRVLLSGTGLVARYSSARAAIITLPDVTTPMTPVALGRVMVRKRMIAERPPSPLVRLAYYQQLKTRMEAVLRADRRTARLAFAIDVVVRIDDEGVLADIAPQSHGDDTRAFAAIRSSLRDAALPSPPPLLEQPLRIKVTGIRQAP